MPRRLPRRIATVSVHTSPLEQPGTGDAGGLNVYVVEVAKRLAARGVEVDIFTRAVSREQPPVAELAPGVLVRHLTAGPFEDLDKSDLPGQLCQFTFELLRTEAASRARPVRPGARALLAVGPGRRRGQGALGRAAGPVHAHAGQGQERGAGGTATPPSPRSGCAARPRSSRPPTGWSPTPTTRPGELISGYDADPGQGGDHQPRGQTSRSSGPARRRQARQQLGLPADGIVLVFAGRVQPLKAPDVVLHAAARLVADDPSLARRLTIAFVGGPSGTGRADPDGLTELAGRLGLADLIRLEPPCPQPELAKWYRAATSSWCRPTPSPSGWSRWRPRPAARRWWRRRSAGCARRSGTGCPGSWWTPVTRPGTRGPSAT